MPSTCIDLEGVPMGDLLSVYDVEGGVVLSAKTLHDASLSFMNVPSTASRCDLMIPLKAGVHMTFDFESVITAVYVSPDSRAILAQQVSPPPSPPNTPPSPPSPRPPSTPPPSFPPRP
eukprot:4991274-Pleurochrysis_carterae.AAC.1